MFCSQCGIQTIEGAAFCQKCGAKLHVDEVEKSFAGSTVTDDLFDVSLIDIGENKVKVIKVVMEITGLDIKDAKELVEKSPVLLKRGVTEAEAQSVKMLLQDVGAQVTISTTNLEENEECDSIENEASIKSSTMGESECKSGHEEDKEQKSEKESLADEIESECLKWWDSCSKEKNYLLHWEL